ncbi:hypothetical protein [Mycobacterium sp.]|nr:hypothetical protein [Mycobacterium sp.]
MPSSLWKVLPGGPQWPSLVDGRARGRRGPTIAASSQVQVVGDVARG